MLGHIDNVPELLQALDIFVFTSDSGEGVPQSVAQALLMETAVISTNVGGINDLYNNENFVLINNEQDLLNLTCDKLLKDNLLRKSYAKKSRKYVSENFSINKMTEKILKTYIDLTEKDGFDKKLNKYFDAIIDYGVLGVWWSEFGMGGYDIKEDNLRNYIDNILYINIIISD